MRIEILTFDDCPNAAIARDRVVDALALESAIAAIEDIEVATVERARATRFLGSPSVRINGKDVEPGADEQARYGLMCRTYHAGDRVDGAPSVELIRAAIRLAKE